jgi:hypothetical protein
MQLLLLSQHFIHFNLGTCMRIHTGRGSLLGRRPRGSRDLARERVAIYIYTVCVRSAWPGSVSTRSFARVAYDVYVAAGASTAAQAGAGTGGGEGVLHLAKMMGGGGIGAAVSGGGVPQRTSSAGLGGAGLGAAASAAADAGLSPPIPVAHIPQAAYGMVLDEQSQQLVKGLFARLDAVRAPRRSRPARRSFCQTARAQLRSGLRVQKHQKVLGTLTAPRASRRMATAC